MLIREFAEGCCDECGQTAQGRPLLVQRERGVPVLGALPPGRAGAARPPAGRDPRDGHPPRGALPLSLHVLPLHLRRDVRRQRRRAQLVQEYNTLSDTVAEGQDARASSEIASGRFVIVTVGHPAVAHLSRGCVGAAFWCSRHLPAAAFPQRICPTRMLCSAAASAPPTSKRKKDSTCDECNVTGPCLVFEQERGGGWWHLFCLTTGQFHEFRDLVEITTEALRKDPAKRDVPSRQDGQLD